MDETYTTISSVTSVAGRYLFYNQFSFDGDNAAANPDDDQAIARDKTALLPGDTASFASYTSCDRRINGVIVRIS